MKNAVIFAAGAALVASSALYADVAGVIGQNTLRYYGADGATEADFDSAAYAVIDLYVDFSAPNTDGFENVDSHMLSTFNMNFDLYNTGTGLFYQSDLTGTGNTGAGSWKPSFSFEIPGSSNPGIDSFITIGGGVGSQAATNVTTPDPNLGSATATDIFNDNVGWFLNPPTSTQGDVLEFNVWIGRFVVTGDDARNGALFTLEGVIGYNYGSGTGSFNADVAGEYTFVPAPGAIALLGLSGLCMRRRRA